MVEFRVLGPLEVADGTQRMVPGGPKERAVLALLLLEPNRVVSLDRLVEEVWEGDPPDSSTMSVRVLVSKLRKALNAVGAAEALVTRAPGYLLDVTSSAVDAARFETLLERGRAELASGTPTTASATLREALALWRGAAYADVADSPFARGEAARLEEARLAAVEERVEADLACGRPELVVGELEALCASHPLRERMWGQRMVALYRCGRQADALRAYHELRAVLVEELGLEPSPELAALEQRILAQDPSLGPTVAGAVSVGGPSAPSTADPGLPSGVVTFLLTDIEGSTALWDAQPEAMAPALERHDQLVVSVISAAGGQVVKSKGEGDAILAVFGRASEATTAALEVQRVLASQDWPADIDVRVRIGVHTGEAHERDGDYFGPTLNRAARVRGLASGGQVLVSRVTADLVRDRLPDGVALVDLGRHELRGLSRDEHVFELVERTLDVADANEHLARLDLPLPGAIAAATVGFFVGRDDEAATAAAAWTRVAAGERHTLLVSGEPGIGKTRLACETTRRAHAEGAVVLFGRCDEDLGVPYQPFAEALSSFVATCAPEELASVLGELGGELARIVPDIARRCPQLPPPAQADSATERAVLFDAVDGWLIALSRRAAGVVLVLDDLHWAAAPTLALLRHLARAGDAAPVLVLGTYRHTDLDRAHALADVLADLRRHDGVKRLALRGLDAEGAAAFVAGFAGQALGESERAMAQLLHDETDGNPFFMAEVLRHLVESGAAKREDGRWVATITTAAEAGLPEGVREVIGRRLSRLSAAANQALAVGAVVGPSFRLSLLERLPAASTDGADSLLDALDESVRAGVLVEAPGGYAFAHALVRQSVYGELTSARRARLHRQVGEAMEALADADVAALAHHFAEAALDGQIDKATHYALAAGERAIAGLAYEEAESIIDRGLNLVALDHEPDVARRADLCLVLATARWALGDRTGATVSAREAFEDAVRLSSGERAARAAIRLTSYGEIFISDASVSDACRAALDLLGEDQLALRARVLAGLARYQTTSQQRCDIACVTAAEALELARRSDDPTVIVAALYARLTALASTGPVDEELAVLHEHLELARSLGDVRGTAEGLILGLACCVRVGEADRVRNDLETLREMAPGQHRALITPILIAADGALCLLEGRFDEAEQALDEMLRSGGGGDQMVVTIYTGLRMILDYVRGRLEEVRAFAEAALERYPQSPHLDAYLALLNAELGETEAARSQLRHTANDLAATPHDLARSSWVACLAQACALLEEVGCAEALERELGPLRGQLIGIPSTVETFGAADRFLAMLAALQRRWDDAEVLYSAALELESRVGSPVFVAETSRWYGRMLVERDRPGDRDRAVELLTTALKTAEELGMAWVAKEARRLLRPALPRPLRAGDGTNFVGRSDDLGRLSQQWSEVHEGGPGLALLAGEPGIGKTRLAAEFAAEAHSDGAIVLFGRCDEDAGTAYQPFVEALRAYAATCPPDELDAHVRRFGADLARLIPEVARRVPALPEVTTSDPDAERLRLFDAVTGFLADASMRTPVVLVLDDLHWATKPTLLLLRHLLRSSEQTRLLVIATYRDTELDRVHPLSDTLAGLQRDTAHVQRLLLRGLDADDVAAYVEAAGDQALGDDELALARALHAETEGNPFFVAEVLRHLVETGAAYRHEDRWVLKSDRVEDLGLPQGVRDVITQRLSRLSDDANRTLAVASVIGPSFALRVLEAMPDAAPGGDHLLDALDEALSAGIIVDAGTNTYTFAHALIRQTLYSELSSARRTRLHRRVGEAIESLLDADRRVDALAYHFAEAAIDGQGAKAASYALSAGGAAMARLAFEEAVAAYERGLAALEIDSAGDPALRADLLLAVAEARDASALGGVREALLEAAALARDLNSSPRLAQAALLLARHAALALADPEAQAVCEEALAALPEGDAALRARVMGELARYRAYGAVDRKNALALSSEAIGLARATGDRAALASVLASATFAYFGSEHPDEMIRLGDELIGLCEEIGDTRGRYEGLVARAVAKRQRADLDGFAADVDLIEQLGRDSRSWFGLAVTASFRASQALLEGRVADTEARLAEMAELGGDDPNIFNLRLGAQLVLTSQTATIDEALQLLDFAATARPDLKAVRPALAGVQAMAGRHDAGQAALTELVADDCATLPRDATWSASLCGLSGAAGFLGDERAAAVLYPKLLPFRGQLISVGRTVVFAAADAALGVLAALLGDDDAAEQLFADAEDMLESIGAAPLLAQTRVWRAHSLLAKGTRESQQRARKMLEAVTAANDRGLYADIARRLLNSIASD